MKKNIIIIIATLSIIVIASLVIWMCQTTTKYYVELHQNIFENSGYLEDNTICPIPFEILLSDYNLDTINSIINSEINILLQPNGNNEADNILEKTIHPKEVVEYRKFKIQIEQFIYKQDENRLYITLLISQKRYQTLFK